MDLKQAHAEIRELAREMSLVPVPEALDLSGRLVASSLRLAEEGPEDETNPEDEALAYLDGQMERLPRKRPSWWLPPRNFLINQAMLGYNFWRFTILPYFAKAGAYSEELGGIIIHPNWTPVSDQLVRELDLDTAKKMVAVARHSTTVQEDVRKELDWIEKRFSIRIPDAIQSKIVKDALPTAKRRWGVDRLRTKNRLIPLDGGPARDL